MKFILILLCIALVTACAHGPSAQPVVKSINLEKQHTSIFNRIRYRVPAGWTIWDGMSDWIAPSPDMQFWERDFSESNDSYYVVSSILPFLTMEDIQYRRVRPLEEIVRQNAHALRVAARAKFHADPQALTLGEYEAYAIKAEMSETHAMFQIFVKIADNEVATVAGHGLHTEMKEISALVRAIASTIRPGDAPGHGFPDVTK